MVSNSLHAQDAKVYFMRSEGFQAPAAAFTVFIDHKLVGRLNNKKFSKYNIQPGEHTFSTQFSGKKSSEKAEKIEVKTEAGKTYYIQVSFKHGLFQNKLKFKQIDEDDAKKLLTGLKEMQS